MSDSQELEKDLEEFYYDQIYLHGVGMNDFKDLNEDEKRQLEKSIDYRTWRLERASDDFAETFSDYMVTVFDDDTVLFIVLFVGTIAFLLLGGMAVLN